MPELKAIHICNSLQPKRKPKIAKEYVLPMLTFELNNKHRKTKQNVKSTTYNKVLWLKTSKNSLISH
jgi:hypothetical protein